MDQKVINEALDNIEMIKHMMEKTKESFVAFSKIFVYWGILFIANSIITLFLLNNPEIMLESTIFNIIRPIVIFSVLAAIIYWQVSKKIPLVGLEKHLMKIWVLILVLNVIPIKVNIASSSSSYNMQPVTLEVNNFSILFFSLAIALIATAIFTGYRQLMYVGIVYILLSFCYAYFHVPLLNDTMVPLLYLLALPFTFLYTGLYLRYQKSRRDQVEYSFDS